MQAIKVQSPADLQVVEMKQCLSWEVTECCAGRVLLHGKPYTLEPANRAVLKNMADLMLREVWGAYEHAHEQRIVQLTKVCDANPIFKILE